MLKMHTTVGSVAPSAIHTSTIRYFTLRFQFEVSVWDAEQLRIKAFHKIGTALYQDFSGAVYQGDTGERKNGSSWFRENELQQVL